MNAVGRLAGRARRVQRSAIERWVPSRREWELVPDGWAARVDGAPPRGWDVEPVVRRYGERLPELRALASGTAPLAVPLSLAARAQPNVHDQNTLLVLAHALLWAASGTTSLSVLDWGGGFGYASFVARAWLPESVDLHYRCVELPKVRDAARVAVPEVEFVDEVTGLAGRHGLVLASSAVQYVEDWQGLVVRLAAATDRGLLLTEVPVVGAAAPYVVLQRTRRYGIDTEYLAWVLNRDEVVAAVERAGLALEREYLLGYRPRVHGAPEQPRSRAFLFRRP